MTGGGQRGRETCLALPRFRGREGSGRSGAGARGRSPPAFGTRGRSPSSSLSLSDAIHLLGNLLGEVLAAQGITGAAGGRGADPRARQGAAARGRRGGDPSSRGRCRSLAHGHGSRAASRSALHAVLRPRQPGRGGPPDPGAAAGAPGSRRPAPISESIGEAVAELRRAGGCSSERDGGTPPGVSKVEIVLTAHPTEAKRRSVLSKLQRITVTLSDLHRDGSPPAGARRRRDRPFAPRSRRSGSPTAPAPPPGCHRRGPDRPLLRGGTRSGTCCPRVHAERGEAPWPVAIPG